MKKRKILSVLLLFAFIVSCFSNGLFVMKANASADAMTEIQTAFSDYKIGEVELSDDGYMGIPVTLSTYYDLTKGGITSGYLGTPVILYVVNTATERIGTDSDTAIIESMLERGYMVAVLDYKNNAKAVSPGLDYSAHAIRGKIAEDDLLANDNISKGQYNHIYVVPSGYNILVEDIFFEIDKHGTDGSLERIVENWNNDLKGCRGNTVISWVSPDGTRKLTANASDGTTPVWYSDASGATVDNENGTYTKLKWTVATDVTDCVNPDGTPIDLNLYATVTYPTNPAKEVPVMAYAACLGTPAISVKTQHVNGFLFNGYVNVIYDHIMVPMTRQSSHGYYDGNTAGAVSKNGLSYSLQMFEGKEVDTAAMRYIRHLALSDPDTYKFDSDHIGVFGYSKGGWMTHLGKEIFQKPLVSNPEAYGTTEELEVAITGEISGLQDKWIHADHHGETRFEAGHTTSYTKNGVTVDGGEVQPWLTFEGNEIISGAQLVYPCVGSSPEEVEAGHAPMFLTNHTFDGDYSLYHTMNTFVPVCKNLDIPTMFFEVDIGHILTYGPDAYHGVDTYNAFYDFAGYYIRGDAVKVAYISPKEGASDVEVSQKITIKFTGAVSADEIEKIKISDSDGNVLNGSWSSAFGNTEWIFTPEDMQGGKNYTVTVPVGIKGDNGKGMESEFTRSFRTKNESLAKVSAITEADGGSYVTVDIPELTSDTNRYVFRFRAENDAANIAEIYTTDSNSAPDSLLGTVNLKGAGVYELDITDAVAPFAGQSVTLFIKQAKSAGTVQISKNGFDDGISSVKGAAYVKLLHSDSPDGSSKALKAEITDTGNRYGNYKYYASPAEVFSYDSLIKDSALEESDYGRKFTVTMKVYDTVSRIVQAELTKCTDKENDIVDYQYPIYNFRTKANEWTTFSFDYTVYDMEYGSKGTSIQKGLTVCAMSAGNIETPLYIDDITVTETVTDISLADFSVAAKSDGGAAYKAPTGDSVFTVSDESGATADYNSFKEMLSAYVSGQTVKLNSNYTLTDADISDGIGSYENLIIDLNGYTINCDNTVKSLLWAKNATAPSLDTTVSISNGGINIGKTPLISFEDSSSAGAGKKFDFDFKNIAFGIRNGATSRTYFTSTSINSGASTDVKITADDCTFDIPDSKLPANSFTVLSTGEGDLNVSYELTSPVFRLTSQKWVHIQKDMKCSVFHNSSEGAYATLILNASEAPRDISYNMGEDAGIFLAGDATEDGYAYYYLGESDYATKYGMIPDEYADAEKYPWIVFDADGNVILATDIFANGGILSKVSTAIDGGYYVFLRRDYEFNEEQFNNFSFINGDVHFDLNGKTVTLAGDTQMFRAGAKSGGTVNIFVENGTFVSASKRSLVRIASTTTGSYDGSVTKTMNFAFDAVKFMASENCTQLFESSTCPVNVVGNLTFNDCEFDLTDAPSGFRLINMTEDTGRLTSEVKINGGKFISDTFDGLILYAGASDKITFDFAKDASGNYPVAVTTSAGAYPPSDNIVTAEGNMMYSNGVADGNTVTYSLTENIYYTKYGTIPVQYADKEAYPFVLFADGAFVGAYSCWADSSSTGGGSSSPAGVLREGAKVYLDSNKGKSCTILLRRDYTIQTGQYGNLSQINGTVNIDLDGNTLATTARQLFVANKKTANNTYLNVKNGTVLIGGGNPLVSFGQNTNGIGYTIGVSFEDVKIGYAQGGTATKIVERFKDDLSQENEVKSVLKFTNCDFDFKTNAPGSKISFVDLSAGAHSHKTDVVLEGGTMTVGYSGGINFLKLDETDTIEKDTAIFRPYNGEYTLLTLPSTASAPSGTFDSDSGQEFRFYQLSEDGEEKTFILADLETPYGAISGEYIDTEEYPFVVFADTNKDGQKECVGGFSCWADSSNGAGSPAGALVCAKDNAWRSGGAVVYMRRDYDIVTGSYNNLCHINGTVIFDLGGNTLTGGISELYGATNKNTNNPVIITKNGTILLESNSLASFGLLEAGNGTKFTLDFENVNIGFAKNATVKTIMKTYTPGTVSDSTLISASVNFTGCNFDFKTNAPPGAITLFSGVGDNGHHSADITIKGGSVIAGDTKNLIFSDIDNVTNANAPDSFSFVRDENGNHTTLTIPVSAAAPEEKFNGLFFTLLTSDGETSTYTLSCNNFIVSYDTVEKTATVTVETAGKYALVFADYSIGGKLENVDVVEFDFKEGTNAVPQSLTDFTLGEGDKILLVNDIASIVPLCKALVIGQ